MTFSRRWVAVGLSLAVGCTSDGTGPGGNQAFVQLLQADPSAPATVAFSIDGVVVAPSISFGSSSPKVTTSEGDHRLAIESFAGTFAELQGVLREGATYYVVSAAGSLYLTEAASLDPAVPPDTGQRNPIRSNIRFVNVPGPNPEPALVHAFLSAPATVDTVQRFGIDTRVASYGTLMYVDPGTISIRIQPQGESTVLAETSFDVARGEVKAVVLERDGSGQLRIRVVVEQ